jgi:hypothetical protein
VIPLPDVATLKRHAPVFVLAFLLGSVSPLDLWGKVEAMTYKRELVQCRVERVALQMDVDVLAVHWNRHLTNMHGSD